MGIFDPKSDLLKRGNFIITQWHGTPDSRIVSDEHGCVAKLEDSDLNKMCSWHECDKGVTSYGWCVSVTCVCVCVCVFVKSNSSLSLFTNQGRVLTRVDGSFTGLRYNQGGYPPLTLKLKKGLFNVMARSDERIFMPKGGCGDGKKECVDHPRQQVHI